MIKSRISFLTMIFVSVTGMALADAPQFPPMQRSINVSGSAQVNVVPDEVQILMGVESWDPLLKNARDENDGIVKNALEIAKAFKIEPRHIQTDFVEVNPEYEDIKNPQTGAFIERKIKGYRVRKSIGVVLKDVSSFENFLSQSLDAGVNYIHNVEFKTTELKKYREQARSMAIQAALKKAQDLTKELGVKVGKPINISEHAGGWYYSRYTPRWGGDYGYGYYGGFQTSQNVQTSVQTGDSGEGTGDTVALGQIQVTASVNVNFEVE